MTNAVSEKELEEFREMFDLVDTTRSGRISCTELRRLMETLRLRPTEEELEHMLRSADGNDPDNGIDFDGFVAMMSKRVQTDYTPEQLRTAFKLFETDDMPTGFVSTEVLTHALVSYGTEKLTHDDAIRLLSTLDPDRTGRINYLEFVSLVGGGGVM
ncbi:calmodulin, putative [Trypanosoma brucei gambiense DAL972]|uniref:Calmodulin, putative n=2 Tax=Trypanosoma brucei TaxID=5691 RepID=D0A6K2_TRYB9|nr:calmodulin, putative [Trypanosoma brucei gambiense DAL972]RHW68413.1 calmodulin [Trypanosoma brucei equiperdum]CBH17303.1 calmodulin, putative [Trypanosoma brucei gambiense DAL972]|eukprot:XP_011779567.1 calmodulin, putative [Trypanosoma brucei gambiense DAL972]